MKNKKFKLALVTGASSGIGEALSYLLAKNGISLILHGRNVVKLEKMAAQLQLQVSVSILVADLNLPNERAKLVSSIHENQPDLFINNAGIGVYGPALCHETTKEMEILNVNAMAVLELTLEAARTLISANKKGVILNVSSAAAWPVSPGMAVYSASKAFVNQFSESFDGETLPHGVRVLAACPGVVATEFSARAGGQKGQKGELKAMSAEFVAKEIWKQVQEEDRIKIIDCRYRFLIFLVKYILPKRCTAYFMRKALERKYSDRSVIKE